MQLTGEREFDIPPSAVWETVYHADVLEECLPGAEYVEKISETAFEGSVERGLASITVQTEIRVEAIEDDRPEEMVWSIEGTDNRTNSTVHGEATISVAPTEAGSKLGYTIDLAFTGRLASLGARLIKRQMNKDIETFFDSLEAHIEERSTEREA